ncbi:MAG: metal-sulfur cluster assembly factor [Firmicutes bacterium]|nr:metal-sulfur cluster assembly factor [Bacillota bacterium]
MPTEQEVMEALKKVFDPELGINVVDLGLIYGVELKDGEAIVKMTLTTQGCPLHDSIGRGVETAIKNLPGIREARVMMVWEPAWSPERMSPAARKQLGY